MTTEEIVKHAIELGHNYISFSKATGVDNATTFRLFKGKFQPSMKNYMKYLAYFESIKSKG